MRAFRAICMTACVAALPALAGEHVLYRFDASVAANGALVRDAGGNLYGTTQFGGAYRRGSVFRFDPDGVLTVLHDFKDAGDGKFPAAGLTLDADGNLYGTASRGGGATFGGGTVFKIAAGGSFSVLHRFGAGAGGANPAGVLLRDASGNLFGTTRGGGNPACNGGCGTVFKIAADGAFSVLHLFRYGHEGSYPMGGVIADAAGNLYGTTAAGGKWAHGTVYQLAPDGKERVLAAFHREAYPTYELVADAQGNLYGTTWNGTGSVFKIDAQGHKSIVHVFKSAKDGAVPQGRLLIDGQGNLYGTTMMQGRPWHGGAHAQCCGTAFKMTPDGTVSLLHAFKGGSDGARPVGGLVVDDKGVFYGTTYRGGGDADGGTIFRLVP